MARRIQQCTLVYNDVYIVYATVSYINEVEDRVSSDLNAFCFRRSSSFKAS